MGTFAALSGVIGSNADRVSQEIRGYVQAGRLREQLPKRDRGTVLQTSQNVSVLYPRSFHNWDDLSQYLSEKLQTPVFSFHIHDGALWMFLLFRNGAQVAQFNTVPNYWEELDADEMETWTGDPATVAREAGVPVENIAPYLVPWNEDELAEAPTFARPGDRYPRGSEWQLADFMRQLGLQYPIDEEGLTLGEPFNMCR